MKESRSPARSSGLPAPLAVILSLVLGVLGLLAVGAAPASAAAPADGSYITCTQDTEATKPVYIVVGGAPIWVRSWAAMGKWTTKNPHPTAKSTNCAALPTHPKNGTFIRGWKAGVATGATYEIVGGAPITLHSWADLGYSSTVRPAVEKVDLASIPAAGASSVTTDAGKAIQGYIAAKPASGAVFAGFGTAAGRATTYYKLDAARHPIPQVAATAGEPVVDQVSINACERMLCDPNGAVVNEYGVGYGRLHVDGWAADYPSASSVSVQLSIGGRTFVVPADRATSYVSASTAGNHGFSTDVPVGAGSYVLCVTILGTAPGATTLPLGCANVSVAGASPGRVHRPKVRAKRHHRLVVRWRQPATYGSPISAYIVKTSTGKKKQVSADRHKFVFKHLKEGGRVRVRVRAMNAVGAGRFSKHSKSVTVR